MKPAARYYTCESDPGYLEIVPDLRRRENPDAPAATFDDTGFYSNVILIDGYESRCEALNHLDRVREVLSWLDFYGVVGEK